MTLLDSPVSLDGRRYSGWDMISRRIRGLMGIRTKGSVTELGEDTDLARVDKTTRKKMSKFSLFDSDALGDWNVHLATLKSGGFKNHIQFLESVSSSVTVHHSWNLAFSAMRREKPFSNIAIVDVDVFETYAEAIEFLSEFRSLAPMTPTVIGSRRFRYNDFSTERSLITDASVKLPVSKVGLGMALNAALSNHRQVVERDLARARCTA